MNVLVEHQEGIAVVTLRRPERHNALIPEMLEQLGAAWRDLAADPAVRAVVLRAAGRSFSTGGDVAAFAAADDLERFARRTVGALHDVMLAMLSLPRPIVTAVHGIVTGGALGLVLAGDVVLVAPRASITPWYGVVGFSPDGGWTALLPSIIGRARTADVLLRNRTITADEAVAWGIAAALVPAEHIEAEAFAVARHCTQAAPGSLAAVKRLLAADIDAVRSGLERELESFVAQIMTDEARRGMERFLRT